MENSNLWTEKIGCWYFLQFVKIENTHHDAQKLLSFRETSLVLCTGSLTFFFSRHSHTSFLSNKTKVSKYFLQRVKDFYRFPLFGSRSHGIPLLRKSNLLSNS